MRKSSLFPRKTQGVDTRYPIGYNVGVAGNDTNAKGTPMHSGWNETVTDYVKGVKVPVVWFHADYWRVRIRFDRNWNHPKPFYISSYNSIRPTEPETRFATIEEAKRFVAGDADTKAIRVPAKFFNDHEERDCEPYCTPVKRTSRFVWLRPDDEGLDELLDDAKHYAEPGQFKEWGRENYGRGIVRSAAATVAAIQQSREAMVSK